MAGDKSSAEAQFQSGYTIPVEQQSQPGRQTDMTAQPTDEYLPTPDGGKQLYKAAGKLQGRKVLLTGGDSGIGRSTAILLAMEGAEIMFTHLESEEKDAQITKQRVEHYGAKCHSMVADLRTKEVCKKVKDAAIEKMGCVNILINNHAVQNMIQDIQELSEEQWENTFQTNIHPFFYLSKYVIPQMKAGDTIINNASINAYVGRPDLLDYTSTKGAIVAFTRGLSNQYVSKGIRVNAVAPGPVLTPLIPVTMTKEAMEQFTAPMGRPSQPSEIATCFVFLASADSSSISGQTIHANGGTVVNG